MITTPTPNEAIDALETTLGLPSGFLDGLLHESDWSFIVKSHAFLEAALTHLLVTELGRPALQDTFARLELSNKTTGKMAFLKSLSLLDDDSRRFVTALSELRNQVVHDVRNVGFTFASHLASLSDSERKAFAKKFLPPVPRRSPSASAFESLILTKPLHCIFAGVLLLANIVYFSEPQVRTKQLLALLTEELSKGPHGA